MLQQRLTRNLYTGQTEPLTAPLSFDFTEDLGDKRNLALLSQYGGAAAAYSLRALGSYNENVVRVRRASDNDEKDFTASQVSSGEMVNWVNSQTVPPLDIGVETSEGRIPVPEGGTSIGTPAAAYSLRNLSTTYTGNVVDVRRSSDDAVESFTAEEVSDGTLEAWVLAPVSSLIGNEFWFDGVDDYLDVGAPLLPATGDFDIEFTWYVANESNPSTILYALSQGTSISNFLGVGLTITGKIIVYHCAASAVFTSTLSYLQKFVKIRLQKVSGNLTVYLDDVSQATVAVTGSILQTNARWGDTTFLTGNRHAFGLIYGDDVTGTANGSPELFTGQGFDGTVSKWYDQSGNTNHAVQTTAASQPKIVDAGVLVTGGIDFDGTDDFLEADTVAASFTGTDQPLSSFAVGTVDVSANQYIWAFGNSASDNAFNGVGDGTGPYRMLERDDLTVLININGGTFSSESLLSFITKGNQRELFANGSSIGSDSTDLGAKTFNKFQIGRLLRTTALGYWNGKISEVIIYPSDQSNNRLAIEANIGETYGISGIPAYDNTVDGFVETWYDQSGNGNDATQSVAANQPKIVDAGVLITRGGASEPSILFGGGADNHFNVAGGPSVKSVFSTLQASDTNFETLICDTTDNTPRLTTYNGANNRVYVFNGFGTPSVNVDGATYNGTSSVASLGFHLLSITSGTGGEVNRIGANPSVAATGNSFNYVSELVIYDSDQSANRTAIEANINNQYSIY